MSPKHETVKSRETKSNKVRLVVVWGLAVAAAGGIVALYASLDDVQPVSAPIQSAVVGAPVTGGEVPAPPGITNPTPYQYDAATNSHFDPAHGHWHGGPPPPAGQRGPSTGTKVPPPPGITNPTPYQYDAATNSHFDPLHGHWHSGPPPR